MPVPIRTTIVFLIKRDKHGAPEKVCLGMKKRGFGNQKWNGAGGKLVEGEDFVESAKRELKEEFGVVGKRFEHVASLDFPESDGNPAYYSQVYFCDKWDGEISESEEMRPEWFAVGENPIRQDVG